MARGSRMETGSPGWLARGSMKVTKGSSQVTMFPRRKPGVQVGWLEGLRRKPEVQVRWLEGLRRKPGVQVRWLEGTGWKPGV